MSLKPLMSSADQTWNTPRWFIDRLERALGRVGLDPCSNGSSVVDARREFRFEDRGENGLLLPWTGHGLVFVNPPFGRMMPKWMERCAVEGDEVVALVPSRTDTAWWHAAARSAQALVLWRGRFAFRVRGTGKGNSPFPSALFYWGPRRLAFLEEFHDDGFMVRVPGAHSFTNRESSAVVDVAGGQANA